ncbi:MAG: response regulator transcription factor, partial [Chloroflexi bacterium]|nr:response regulator transcription factor [Chloroflexota bacterium]
MKEWVRVLVVDDCALLFEGVRQALAHSENFKIIGEANDGATALAWMERERPDIVLLDCRLPDLSGWEVAALAQARGYPSRLIGYSAHEEYDDVMGMLQNGAVGYVTKDESAENLFQAIETVARGGTWFSQRISKKLVEWALMPAVELTVQETNVLRLLARGKTDAEIMAGLGIAPRTLRHHLRNIMDKLHLE